MEILENEGKLGFSTVFAAAAFADGTPGRIEEKGAVVRFAIVVASGAKAERTAKNEQGGRELPPMMIGIDQWRIERGDIWTPFEELAFQRAKSGVKAEAAENKNNR